MDENTNEEVTAVAKTEASAPAKKKCPHCKRVFSARGLQGHLRFAHQVAPAKASKLAVNADEDSVARTTRILEIVEDLCDVRNKRVLVEKMNTSSFFQRDDACDEMQEALNEEEERLKGELKKLRVPRSEENSEKKEEAVFSVLDSLAGRRPGK